MTLLYGYARVSTPGQAKNGYSLQHQVEVLKGEGCAEVFKDVCSGATLDRPGLSALLAKVKIGDGIVVTSTDRFSRSVCDGSELIEKLRSEGISFKALDAEERIQEPGVKELCEILSKMKDDERKKAFQMMADVFNMFYDNTGNK